VQKVIEKMEYIYMVVDGEGAFPDAFTSYSDALAEVKDKYKHYWGKGGDDYWSSQQDDDDIEEGSKVDEEHDENPNVTQISIYGRVALVTIYRIKIKR
jgi:hypothetical protein